LQAALLDTTPGEKSTRNLECGVRAGIDPTISIADEGFITLEQPTNADTVSGPGMTQHEREQGQYGD
jgi:hypothetical protein